MKITMKQERELSIVKLETQQLDASVAPELKQRIEDLILDGNHKMILDMSAINTMDNSSLGALVSILSFMSGKGRMVLMGLKDPVKTLFNHTHMDSVFTLADSESLARQKVLH